MRMTGIVAVENEQEGLYVNGLGIPIEISDSVLSNNTHGLRLVQCISKSTFRSVVCTSNREAGIFSDNSDGLLDMSAVTMTGNNKYGLSYVKTDICKPSALAGNNARQLTIRVSEFHNNHECGVNIKENCGLPSVIDTTKFLSSKKGFSASYGNSNIAIKNCTFTNHADISVVIRTGGNVAVYNGSFHSSNRAIDVASSSNKITIEKCKFVNHTELSVMINPGGNVIVRNNVFNNNHMSCLDIQNGGSDMSVDRNSFKGNAIDSSLPLYILDLTTISAVVILRTSASVTMRLNQFVNPDMQFQLATTVRDIDYSIDALYNYWGSADVNLIASSIYDYHHQGALASVRYYPYLLQRSDNTDIVQKYPDVIRGHNIGGVIRDKIELFDTHMPYHVTKDLIIHATGTLLIGEGVMLEFEPGRGILVMGTLQVLGSSSNEVVMTAKRQTRHPHMRLLNEYEEGQTVSGIVQIFSNTTWRSLCYRSFSKETATLDFLCRAIGFERHYRYNSVQNSTLSVESLPTLQCRSGRFSECKFPDEGFTTCSDDAVLALTCQRNFWNGIHLEIDAHPSIIRNTRLYHTNHRPSFAISRAAIHVDFLQNHEIDNVLIEDMFDHQSSRGLFVSRVGNHCKSVNMLTVTMCRGTAVMCHDSRIHLHDLNATCMRQHAGNGVYIESKRATIAGLKTKLIVPFTTVSKEEITRNKSLFLNVNSRMLPQGSEHYIRVTTSDDNRINVEIVRGTFSSCANQVLFVYDGLRNDSVAVGLMAGPDGTLFHSTGSSIELWMRQELWMQQDYGGCMDAVLHVYVSQGKISQHISLHNMLFAVFINTCFYGTKHKNSHMSACMHEHICCSVMK